MYVAGAWFASVMQDEYPDINDLWDAAPLPEKVRCATTIAGDALIMPEQGQNHDAAWKWIEFLSAPQNMLWALGVPDNAGSVLPRARRSWSTPNVFDLNPVLEGFAQQMECGVTGGAPNPATGRSRSPSMMLWVRPSTARSTPPRPWMRPMEGEAILSR